MEEPAVNAPSMEGVLAWQLTNRGSDGHLLHTQRALERGAGAEALPGTSGK